VQDAQGLFTTTSQSSAPVRSEDNGNGHERATAVFTTADLMSFSADGATRLQLCDQRYVFNGSALKPLLQ